MRDTDCELLKPLLPEFLVEVALENGWKEGSRKEIDSRSVGD